MPRDPRIANVEAGAVGLSVAWRAGGPGATFPRVWLRDHGFCVLPLHEVFLRATKA